MYLIRGHLFPYVRGESAAHAMTRLSRTLRELEGKGYSTEAVAVYATDRAADGTCWAATAALQNPDTLVPARETG